MSLDIKVLEKMIEFYSENIKMFQNLFEKFGDEYTGNKLAELVSTRRLIAAMIENDGELLFKGMIGHVFFDTMLYSACAGADTSKW